MHHIKHNSNELELSYSGETRFGQAFSYGIHCSNGGGNLAFFHCGGTKKEQQAQNLCGFLKIECYDKKRSLFFTFLWKKYLTWW